MKNTDLKKIVSEQIKEILLEEEEKPKHFTIDQINRTVKKQTKYDIQVLKSKMSYLEKILNCEHEWINKNYPPPNEGKIQCKNCGSVQNTKIPEKTIWDEDREGDWM